MKKPPPRHMTAEEKRLWRHITRNDKRLPFAAEDEEPDAPLPTEEPSITLESIMPPRPRPLPSGKTLVQGDYAGIDRNTATRVRKGKYPIDATLDLHGHTQAKAHELLIRFIRRQHAAGSRCLLVITGKGRAETPGILRAALPQWLAAEGLREYVLAFDHARQSDGGSGAYYLLLRRQRQDTLPPKR